MPFAPARVKGTASRRHSRPLPGTAYLYLEGDALANTGAKQHACGGKVKRNGPLIVLSAALASYLFSLTETAVSCGPAI